FRHLPREVRDAALRIAERPEIIRAPTRTIAWFDGVTVAEHDGQLVEVSSPRSVLATGAYERAVLFDGNDLPGIMLASAAVKLALGDGVIRGGRAVVVTRTDDGYAAALALQAAGVAVAAVLDLRITTAKTLVEKLVSARIPLLAGVKGIRATGSPAVRKL